MVTVTPSAARRASTTPNSRSSLGRAEHHLDVAALSRSCLGQPEQRRAAVAAADQHARHRLGRQRERLAERADDVDLVVQREPGDPRVPGPWAATTMSTVPP